MNQENHLGRKLLPLVILGNALLRIAGSAGGILIGLYLGHLNSTQEQQVSIALVGTLGAITFIAELVGALPLGVLSDAIAPRVLMVIGSLLGAIATQIFGMSGAVTIFFLSRALEGIAIAASGPPVLAHLTDITEGDAGLRGKVMSYYEMSLLGGLALGGLLGSTLWEKLGTAAFSALAAAYVVSGLLLGIGAVGSKKHKSSEALSGLVKALRDPYLIRFAPAWLAINSIVGLWVAGSTLPLLLTLEDRRGQVITGSFAGQAGNIGYLLLVYALIFATGVTIWSFFIARFTRKRVFNIALIAMFFVCAGLYVYNHSQSWPPTARYALLAVTAIAIMVESGFTPAALAMLADVVGAQGGRGAAMGIYSVLLGVGAIIGSLLAGVLGGWFAVDGLIYGTMGMAVIAFITVSFLPDAHSGDTPLESN